MKRNKYSLYALVAIILAILYLISSTDFIYKEQEKEIYQISVILNETSDTTFENIKLGMKQVEREYAVEVNVVTLYEPNNAKWQMELVEREVGNGAEAIILFPLDANLTSQYLMKEKWNIPIVCVETYLSEEVVDAWIHGDEIARGQELGKKMIEDGVESIYTLAPRVERSNISQRLEALKQVMKENSRNVHPIYYETEEELAAQLLSLNEESKGAALVALDTVTLSLVMSRYRTLEWQNLHIYGIGYTNSILGDLEKGRIKALSIHNDYDLGYLSLATAVSLLHHQKVPYDQNVIGGLVTKDNMYGTLYEKILFPIN